MADDKVFAVIVKIAAPVDVGDNKTIAIWT